jgi:type I restriction enzyme M protein
VGFYEQPPPEGRKNYSKTKPLAFEEFAQCQAWWGGADRKGRIETERAWRVPIADIETDGFNLDRKNPNRPDDLSHLPPEQLVTDLLEKERQIHDLLLQIQTELSKRSQ